MSKISPDPMDTQMTQLEIDEMMKLNTTGELSAYREQWLLDHGYVKPDAWRSDVLHEVAQPAVAAAKSQVSAKLPNGTTFTGTSEEVAAKVGEQLARNAEAARVQIDDVRRDSQTGRFTADQGRHDESEALRAAAAAELELRFKRGEVSAADYIAQSGVMDQYLASRGIDVKAHQAQQQEGQQIEHSWSTATAQFKARHTDWPGGENLMHAMIERIDKLGLTESASVETLERAYTALSIEADMAQENDPYKMEALKERWRNEVEGRFSGPRYNQ